MKRLLIPMLLVFAMFSCKEDIVIDLEEGDPLIGVEGSFTDEFKCHEVILRYTSDFYNADEARMIRGAKVWVTDGVDTVEYFEREEQPGHYLTLPVAGHKRTHYTLLVDVPDEDEPDGFVHLTAESYMNDNVERIDSLVLKTNPLMSGFSPKDTLYLIYPYFQSLSDPSIIYMVHLTEHGVPRYDTLTDVFSIPVAGFAGYYVNGPEMLEHSMEIPVGMVFSSELTDGDTIRLDLLSIPRDYMIFTTEVKSSLGSNPLMGPPSNVSTNLRPEGKAVGFFYAASVASVETVYHPKD